MGLESKVDNISTGDNDSIYAHNKQGVPGKRNINIMIKNFLIVLLFLQTSMSLADADPDTQGNNYSYEQYLPHGRYINFATYSLFYACEGESKLSVIIEGGIGYSLADWLPIQKALATHVRTCVYDRPGYGMSYEGVGARTVAQIAAELHDLLQGAHIPGPYILVGHSFGGYIVQYYAKKHPHDMAGAVLIESSHPDQVKRLEALNTISENDRREILNPISSVTSGTPQDAQSFWQFLNVQRKSIHTQMNELKYFTESAYQVAHAGKFPDIPLAVITRDRELLPATADGYSMEKEWRDMQRDLVTLSKQGWQIIATNSGHSVNIDAPDLVIQEILKVIAKIN